MEISLKTQCEPEAGEQADQPKHEIDDNTAIREGQPPQTIDAWEKPDNDKKEKLEDAAEKKPEDAEEEKPEQKQRVEVKRYNAMPRRKVTWCRKA